MLPQDDFDHMRLATAAIIPFLATLADAAKPSTIAVTQRPHHRAFWPQVASGAMTGT
jgi:ABC-type sugar transport system substrate-binding protein